MCTRNFFSFVEKIECSSASLSAWQARSLKSLSSEHTDIVWSSEKNLFSAGKVQCIPWLRALHRIPSLPFWHITWTCPAGSAPQIISGDISLRRNILQGTKVCLWPVPFTVAAYFAVPFTVAAYWNRVRGTSNLWVWVWETLAHCKVWGQEKSPCIPQLHLRTNLNSNVQPLVHISKPCTYSAQVSSLG